MPSTSAKQRPGSHRWIANTTSGWGGPMAKKPTAIHSIKAFGLAKKVRDEFEHAVQLEKN